MPRIAATAYFMLRTHGGPYHVAVASATLLLLNGLVNVGYHGTSVNITVGRASLVGHLSKPLLFAGPGTLSPPRGLPHLEAFSASSGRTFSGLSPASPLPWPGPAWVSVVPKKVIFMCSLV